ncbi:hypothetical protein ZOSMA_121G00310 [Zostera marina]|uniref:RING-type E3 ubiquitin transferase n=1 Tax=Zostera marina TaxID=29655 RepID=A0A0K9Q2Y1_ZOSMR|nr:hypothetical protein ZOSMA_121G00310 [Zostera marina]
MSDAGDNERTTFQRNSLSLQGVIVFAAFMGSFTFLSILVCYCLSRNSRRRRLIERAAHHQTFRSPMSSSVASVTIDVGLKEDALKTLPEFIYNSAASGKLECPVCLEDFEEEDIGRSLPVCEHSFHVKCVDMWLKSNSTCPVCRSVVKIQLDDHEPEPPPPPGMV